MGSISTQLKYRNWRDKSEWLQDASIIVEKKLPMTSRKEPLMHGTWQLCIGLPVVKRSYFKTMKAGMALLVAVGVKPENAYAEDNRWLIWLKAVNSYQVQKLARRIRVWLINEGYETRFEDPRSYPPLAAKSGKEIVPAFIRLIQVEEPALPGKWHLTVQLSGGAETSQRSLGKVGKELVTQLGLTPEGPELVDFSRLDFYVGDFAAAKAKAKYAIFLLTQMGYPVQVSWGDVDFPLDSLDEDTLRGLNETGHLFYPSECFHASVRLADRANHWTEKPERRLYRLLARLTRTTDTHPLKLKLTRTQVIAALDLLGEFADSYMMQSQAAETGVLSEEDRCFCQSAGATSDALREIVDKLRTALRPRFLSDSLLKRARQFLRIPVSIVGDNATGEDV